ncbi:hypothetical protein [Arcanobacterium urinimassiliense]|uniref:hypothetical protein n=1 Tax=Arcanobacterium urinimassiliense TaxID=1871014 RepID=UPI00093E3349|nr:hypothetical protein [Arcanobacterium urinimassiliense]
MTEVIIALGGGVGIAAIITALAALLKRSKQTMQELSPDHGGSLKDQVEWLVEAFKAERKYRESERESTHEIRGLLTSRVDGHDREIKELKAGQSQISAQVESIGQKMDSLTSTISHQN